MNTIGALVTGLIIEFFLAMLVAGIAAMSAESETEETMREHMRVVEAAEEFRRGLMAGMIKENKELKQKLDEALLECARLREEDPE